MINKRVSSAILALLTSTLTACGGGTSSNSSSTNSVITGNETPVSNIPQPKAIEAENWQSARIIQADSSMQNSVEIVGTQLHISVLSNDLGKKDHLQIYINSDNKPETGFQFENQAWEESGVDFLIEDGDLFKSTANNTGWNWNMNIGAIDYSIDTDSANASIDLSLLGDICNNLKIGVMTRDEFWDIKTFSPASSKMQTFNVAYCNTQVADTVDPEISLLGANPVNLSVGDIFTDPGASASDNIDGDITDRIIPRSTVNTAIAGTYEVIYAVSDLAGNSTKLSRVVIVTEEAQSEGIVVDGNTNDWNEIPTLTSTADAIMKVTDDEDKLYILITSSNLGVNTQILMDTDRNATTGLELSAQINAWLGGADYMIENNSLDKSKSNTGWSWDYGIAPIEYIKTADALEIAIKKSDFNQLTNTISMGYVSRTAEWNVNYVLPSESLPSYTLQFPIEANPVIANNDSVSTPYDQAITIDVLANDEGIVNLTAIFPPNFGSTQVEFGSTAKIIYTPYAGFSGIDRFTYQITDSEGNSDTAEVKVIVTPPIANNPPITVDDIYIVDIATQTSVLLDVLENDYDPDGDSLTLINVVEAPGGAYSLSNDNKVLFIPSQRINEIPGIPYTVADGNGGTTTGRFTVKIIDSTNASPIANDDLITTNLNQSVTFDVLENDYDPDGDELTADGYSSGGGLNGNVVYNQNGSYTYIPNEGFVGVATFSYFISDGKTGSARGTVTVTVVDPTPNASPVANDDSSITEQDTAVTIEVLSNDRSYSGSGEVKFVRLSSPSNGSAVIVNSQIVYIPNAGFTGTDNFTYTIKDSNGQTTNATVVVTVRAR